MRSLRTEAALQAACVKHARGLGVVAIKLSMMGRYGVSGWPDYEFLFSGGRVWFVEFKAPGGKTTVLQNARIAELRQKGFEVDVIHQVEYFEAAIQALVAVRRKKPLPGAGRATFKRKDSCAQ
jgi:hypothetical protein